MTFHEGCLTEQIELAQMSDNLLSSPSGDVVTSFDDDSEVGEHVANGTRYRRN
jgi:hypothetical protein